MPWLCSPEGMRYISAVELRELNADIINQRSEQARKAWEAFLRWQGEREARLERERVAAAEQAERSKREAEARAEQKKRKDEEARNAWRDQMIRGRAIAQERKAAEAQFAERVRQGGWVEQLHTRSWWCSMDTPPLKWSGVDGDRFCGSAEDFHVLEPEAECGLWEEIH